VTGIVREAEKTVGECAIWFVHGAWWVVPADEDAPVIVPDGQPPVSRPCPN
jgi:hypothetical protein